MIDQAQTVPPGAARDGVRWLLRVEGLLILAVAVSAYAHKGQDWRVFLAAFLLPDLALLGYLGGPRIGAVCYNSLHSSVGPLVCLLASTLGGPPLLLPLALIWLAHIGFDRTLGYGLKYEDGFGFTHLGQIGAMGHIVRKRHLTRP
ncbi:hypothetical protein Hrubri_1185 [Herbaspirillum rubrisubalbicans M1]|uniref:DUF4260 domain-containing protein n=1 Tax=Herbaspirillum rubrisubalbicans TaxID=80842 RepID=UPI00073A07A1|nr:DUF4260 domain-containing protein [Herbaspirillum rubrisubalbicans]ALU88397.1 hypothetical protein Hrubri_1185 [Herbaspirillum rubrisubalbicans M1]